MPYSCTLKEMPARPVVSVRTHTAVEGLPQLLGQTYGQIIQHLTSQGVAPAGMPFVAYYNMDMQNLDVEIGFPVAATLPGEGAVQSGVIPAGKYVTTLHSGPYQNLGSAYEELTKFAHSQGVTPSGVSYEVYLNSPVEVPPEELQTEIWFPVG